MKSFRTAALLFLFSATALAQFEGVAEFRVSTTAGRGETMPGHGILLITKNAIRMDWEMSFTGAAGSGKGTAPNHVKMTMIQRLSDPNRMTMINDETKSYYIFDLTKIPKQPGEKYTVQKLGRDSVAGVSCEKALLTSPAGQQTEVCVSREIAVSSAWIAAMNRRGQSGPMEALRANGLDGFPVRWISRGNENSGFSSTMELVRLEKKSVSASSFTIPAGYHQTSMPYPVMGADAQKAMKDALDKMTPEQRKMYEDMMKKQQEKQ